MLRANSRFAIRLLRQRGYSVRGIRKVTGHDRKSIAKVLSEDVPTQERAGTTKRCPATGYSWFKGGPCASAPDRRGRRSLLEPFAEQLDAALAARVVCVERLLHDLQRAGYAGSKRSSQRFLHVQRARLLTATEHDCEWMRMVLQGAIDHEQVKAALTIGLSEGDFDLLLNHVLSKPLKLRSRALAVLASAKGMTPGLIAQFLCVSRVTVRNYISEFRAGGAASVLDLTRKEVKKVDDPKCINAVFKVLHTPPAALGFNRTAWRMDDLQATPACEGFASPESTFARSSERPGTSSIRPAGC